MRKIFAGKVRFLILLLAVLSLGGTASGQNLYIGEGETLTLNVPSVSPGYVDKAIWACSSPAISFVEKSEISATIKAVSSFEERVTVELLYVQKYVDAKGFTRANTYSKNFYLVCKQNGSSGGSSSMPKGIIIEPEIRVALGEKAKIKYSFIPSGTKTTIHTTSNDYFKSVVIHPDDNYIEGYGRTVGQGSLGVYFYDEKDERVSDYCKLTVYDPTWVTPQSMSLQPACLLKLTENKKILTRLYPANANTLFNWRSSNYKAVSVSDGVVKAKSTGIADVTVTTTDGLRGKTTVVVIDENDDTPGLKAALNVAAKMIETTENEIVK